MSGATDLRAFLNEHEADCTHVRRRVELAQVGALTAQAADTIVFHDITGYPDWELVDLLFMTRRAQARVLECDPAGVVPRLTEVLRYGPRPLRERAEAPWQEIVATGEDVDLRAIPIVTHTDIDPYPYTTGFAIHRDPESGALNQMNPRCGVLDHRSMVTSFVTPTANRFLAHHREAKTKMPQAIVIGAHPAWELAGVYSHPHAGWWELELFEAITGRPGELAHCRTVDLAVPADAEVVIEGFIDPEKTAVDGPSPGPTMLFTPYASKQPVFDVTAISRRAQPIYRNHQMTPFTDHQELPRLFHEALIYTRLQAMGLAVRDVHFPSGGGALMCVIQIDPTADGQVTDALLSVMGSGFINTKMVVAVDPDINIYDYRDLWYAIATRVDPARDVITIGGTRGWMFDPTVRPIAEATPAATATRHPSLGSRWAVDATKPPRYRSAARQGFERVWPQQWEGLVLGDFLTDEPTAPS